MHTREDTRTRSIYIEFPKVLSPRKRGIALGTLGEPNIFIIITVIIFIFWLGETEAQGAPNTFIPDLWFPS